MCYTCRHYLVQEEAYAVRDDSGKLLYRRRRVERCRAKSLAELKVPAVVDGQPVGLVSRVQFERMLDDARTEGRPLPTFFGSERRYYEGDSLVECGHFQRKERYGR